MLLSSESEDAIVKLADFGFAKKIGTLGTLHTPCGSPVYTGNQIFIFFILYILLVSSN